MRKHTVLWKKMGETPLQAVEAWRAEHSEYARVSMSYAGRLDPMAEGKLLVLIGEECKKQKKYTKLDKEYEIEVLLDAGSDTGDALGVVEYAGKETRIDKRTLASVLTAEKGTYTREYPVYSSKTVNGRPLFLYALQGALDTIEMPLHEEKIYDIALLRAALTDTSLLRARIDTFLKKVPLSEEESKALGADFRIDRVRESWRILFERAGQRRFAILTLRVACGSGTYMRSLAPRIGEVLGTYALALSITRTKIGKRAAGFWWQTY